MKKLLVPVAILTVCCLLLSLAACSGSEKRMIDKAKNVVEIVVKDNRDGRSATLDASEISAFCGSFGKAEGIKQEYGALFGGGDIGEFAYTFTVVREKNFIYKLVGSDNMEYEVTVGLLVEERDAWTDVVTSSSYDFSVAYRRDDRFSFWKYDAYTGGEALIESFFDD